MAPKWGHKNNNKERKIKTNPMVCYSNPILSPKMRISTILEKPFYAKRTQWYVIQTQNKSNLCQSSTNMVGTAAYPVPTLRLFRKVGAGLFEN
jgi:hypothetical protein